MRDSVRPVRGDYNYSIEIKIADSAVRRSRHLITQAQVQGEVFVDAVIILNELGEIPIARGVQTGKKILFTVHRHAQQQVGGSTPPVGAGQVIGIAAAEDKVSARIRELEEVTLLAAEIDAKLHRVIAVNPGQRIRSLEDIFKHMFWKPLRVPE